MFRKAMLILWFFSFIILLSACTSAEATSTSLPPSVTPVPPTATSLPPSATPRPSPTKWVAFTKEPNVTPTQYPAARVYAPILYSPKADQALLLTGTSLENPGGMSHDAWLFDPQTQQWKRAKNMPSGCTWSDIGAAYDSHADRVLAYCRSVAGLLVEYDFATDTWTSRNAGNPPPKAINPRLAYDSESQKTILIGGIRFDDKTKQFEETWAYDYASNTWTKMSPKVQPPGLFAHTIIYDTESDRVIYWGGRFWLGDWDEYWNAKYTDNMVWIYDYNADTWESLPITSNPTQPSFYDYLQYISSTYIQDLDLCYYYWDSSFYAYNDNRNSWEVAKGDLKANIGYRKVVNMTYLASIERVLVFGGILSSDDFTFSASTWLYDPKSGDWTQAGP